MVTSRVVGLLFGLTGMGGASLYAAYEITKERISDALGTRKIVLAKDSEKDAWEKLKKRLDNDEAATKAQPSSSSPTTKQPLSKTFQDLKTKKADSSELMKTCSSLSGVVYRTLFGGMSEDLLKDVKYFCTINFRAILGQNALNINDPKASQKGGSGGVSSPEHPSKAIVTQSVKALKDHDDSKDGILDEELTKLKGELTESNEGDK